MGISIDFSLSNIWRSWNDFDRGKKRTWALDNYKYDLEKNLFGLFYDLSGGSYCHSGYRKFIVSDNKKRVVSEACVRDKIVHRLLYNYLVEIFDKTFIFDVWSCRTGKGLHQAIFRCQKFCIRNKTGYFWRADVKKFFDNIDQRVLIKLVFRRVKDARARRLIVEIVFSFNQTSKIGLPIGNLTSQIFVNIYLNELDRFIKHNLGIKGYLRYGDDFVIFANDLSFLKLIRLQTNLFLMKELKLGLNNRSDIVNQTNKGVKFLGVMICREIIFAPV